MRIRDKIITAACRTPDGFEWTSLNLNQEGHEPVAQDRMDWSFDADQDLTSPHLPTDLSEHLKGEVTVALRSSELLMRTMRFPTSDPSEVAAMVEFQVDKISPFPIDQLAISHEILQVGEEAAQVLMAAAKRTVIDTIGDVFEKQKVRIHSIDARIMGWLHLMERADRLSASGCEIIIIVDGIDFVLTVIHDGLPVVFRPLRAQLDDMAVIEELNYEIGYTLTTLNAEYDLPAPTTIHFWSYGDKPGALLNKLSEKSGLKTVHHDLHNLPPLSQGILWRSRQKDTDRIELIPREWVEHQARQKLNKRFGMIAGGIAAVWLMVLLAFFGVFKVRDMQYQSVKADAEAIAPMARAARQNQEKLKKLKAYTDRSDSALECLREVSRLLPAGDIDFTSYNYSKDKGVSIRGTARDQDIVTDFYAELGKSALFDGLKNESVNNKTTKGVTRAIYSVTLPLANQEEN